MADLLETLWIILSQYEGVIVDVVSGFVSIVSFIVAMFPQTGILKMRSLIGYLNEHNLGDYPPKAILLVIANLVVSMCFLLVSIASLFLIVLTPF